MTLKHYFNSLSNKTGLSANARSLYFAILGEFDSALYPEQLKRSDTYLQQVSGIKSAYDFDTARKDLINIGVITYNNQFYKLLEEFSDLETSDILKVWAEYEGEKLVGSKILEMCDLAKINGSNYIIQAIKEAGEKNDYENFPKLTYRFFKTVLQKKLTKFNKNEGEKNGRLESEEWEKHIAWLDD